MDYAVERSGPKYPWTNHMTQIVTGSGGQWRHCWQHNEEEMWGYVGI